MSQTTSARKMGQANAMSTKRKPNQAPEPPAPYGTEKPRPRWVLYFWIVLCAGCLVFLIALALRDSL